MKSKLVFGALLPIFLFSCAQDSPKVKHKISVDSPKIKVSNTIDPVCHMKVEEYSSYTAQLNGKTYGFCTESCKKEFNKNPAKYAEK